MTHSARASDISQSAAGLPVGGRGFRDLRGWALMALLLPLQWDSFCQHVLQEVAWAYPTHNDQAMFLSQAYTADDSNP